LNTLLIDIVRIVRTFTGKAWQLTLIGTNYDGTSFGRDTESINIHQFDGAKEITSLSAYPLANHHDEPGVRKRLLERGHKFVELRGVQYKQYKGIAHVIPGAGQSVQRSLFDSDDSNVVDTEKAYQTVRLNGRIMIDCDTFGRENPGNRVKFTDAGQSLLCNCYKCASINPPPAVDPETNLTVPVPADIPSERSSSYNVGSSSGPTTKRDHDAIDLSEKDLILCPPFLLGFSLITKKWCRFYVDNVQPLQLNTKAFDELQIAEAHKQLIQAMVEDHVEGNDKFDDVIAGKGKSLIFLLHGPPGVGKTLTAESIADHTKSPLWSISSGELGTDAIYVEENLSRILDIATTWGAVVLLDEADVFLQQRSGGDVKRNALVSGKALLSPIILNKGIN
jgi:hypothetical protein